MQGTVFIFQICAVEIAFIVFPETVKDDDGILNRHSLLTARVYYDGYKKLLIFSYAKFKT